MLFPIHDQHPIYKDIIYPLRVAVRVILEGIGMGVQLGGAVTDAVQVEDHQVGPGAGSQHATAAEGNNASIKEIESEINPLAAQLWGLTDKELKEIQESLEELG